MSVASRWVGWARASGGFPAGPLAGADSIIARWNGDGLADGAAVGTSTAGTGDNPFTTVTASAWTIDATGARSPRLQMDQQAATAAQVIWSSSTLGALSGYAIRAYVELSAYPSVGAPLIQMYGSSSLRWRVDVTSAGLLRLRDASNAIVDTAAVALTVGAEHRIEVVVAGTTATVYAYLADSTTALLTLTGTVGSGADEVRWGNTQTAPTWPTLYWDGLAVSSTSELIGPIPAAYVDPGLAQPSDARVELFIDEAWVDVSPHVQYIEAINIRRGSTADGASTEPTSCTFTLRNPDGIYTPSNPNSPYYGKIGRNTQCRVSVLRHGTRRYRFYGDISSWPVQSDTTGRDLTIAIEAAGPLRRLGQGASPLASVLYRAMTHTSDVDTSPVVAYWPLEDKEGSTRVASGLPGGRPMNIIGTPTFESNTSFVASDALPVMGSASFAGLVPYYTSATTAFQVRFLLKVPTGGATNGQVLCRVNASGGTIARWDLYYGTGGDLGVRAYDTDNTLVDDSGLMGFGVDGADCRIGFEVAKSGSNVVYSVRKLEVGETTGIESDITILSETVGRATKVTLAPDRGLTDTAFGHLSVQSAITTIYDLAEQLNAYTGERAYARATRLGLEEGIPLVHVTKGLTADTTRLGWQTVTDFVSHLSQAAAADLGILYEARDQNALAIRYGMTLYNQTAAVTLSHASHQLSAPLAPLHDDRYVRNDVTVTRIGGSSSRATLDEGELSTQVPPNGVGRYGEAVSLSLADDSQTADQASWRRHLGTVNEPRYPSISVNLSHPAISDDPGLVGQILSADLGDRLVVTDPPAHLPPDDISQIVQGYTERIDQFVHTIAFNCAPESPYRVGVYDTSRYDTAGSELASLIDADDTSISVSTTSGPLWTTDAADMPFDIRCGGEVMTVTAISGAASPQTFTVTRSVNGITKSHAAGAAVSLADPVVYAL